ncbi:MAG TPA: ATP-binding protein [Marmoricola sp.]
MTVAWRELTRRFVAGIDHNSPSAGTATRTLFLSLRRAFLVGIIVLQCLVAIGAVIDCRGRPSMWLMLLATGLLAYAAWLLMHDRCPAWVVVVGVYGTVFAAGIASDSPDNVLTFNDLWLAHVASALPAVFVAGWPAFVLHAAGCIGFSTALAIAHPAWGHVIPRGQIVAGYSIMIAIRGGFAVLSMLTSRADAQAATAAAGAEQSAWERRLALETMEHTRTLHDTVINTLAAIAVGGGGVRDLALVRERCASDNQAIDDLLAGRRSSMSGTAPLGSLRKIGIRIEHTGLDQEQLSRAYDQLPETVSADLDQATFEVVQNASKHAGVDVVTVDAQMHDDRLCVTVTDHGVGFDPQTRALRGLDGSVFRRAERSGIAVDLESRPGHGTVVRLLAPSADAAPQPPDLTAGDLLPSDDGQLASVLAAVRGGARYLWAVGVLLVGVVLEVTSQPGRWTPTYLSLLVGFAAVPIAWLGRNAVGHVRTAVEALLTVAAAVGFVWAAATSRFGRVDPALWQLLTTTGTCVLVWSLSKRAGVVALGVQVATAIGVAVYLWPESTTAACIILSGVTVPTLFVVAFDQFDLAVERIGQQAADNRRRLLAMRFDARLREASEASRQRWRDAGLTRVRDFLSGLADGSADPTADAVRLRCGEEESYLRQLIQLSPDLIRLGPWLTRALDTARDRGVDLRIHCGDAEPSSDQVADTLGRMLVDVVDATPRNQSVTMSVFEATDTDLLVTLVAPHGRLEPLAPVVTAMSPTGEVLTFGEQDLLQVTVPA